MVEFDWTLAEKIGIAGLAFALLFILYKLLLFFLEQWKESTEALNRNSDAYEKLADVFQMTTNKQFEFQKEILVITKDTNQKVTELHKEIFKKGEK